MAKRHTGPRQAQSSRTAATLEQRDAGASPSRALKHKRDLELILRALYRVLHRAGLDLKPYREGWLWNEALRPLRDGSQNTRVLAGYAAKVTWAAARTADTCAWITGPLGELTRRASAAQSAHALAPWLRRHYRTLLVHLENAAAFHEAFGAFGSLSDTAHAAAAKKAVEELALIPTEEAFAHLRTSLAKLAPSAVTAGLYRGGGGGPKAEFRLYLREFGISYEEIAAILGEVSTRDAYESVDVYQRVREACIDAQKHCLNDAKGKLRRAVESDRLLKTAAQFLPSHQPVVVLFSMSVRRHSAATLHL